MIMKEEHGTISTRSILISFAVGGLVGAGAALLLAPKSGKELRKDIKNLAGEARDKVVTTVEKGKELYVENTTAVKHAVEAGKTAYLAEMEKYRKAA
jgi:gas vesicle protein